MLAVQRQSMAPGQQPSEDGHLFGYRFDNAQESLLTDAPEPPAADPLLTDNDNIFLDTFFDNWDANRFDLGHPSDQSLAGTPIYSEYWNLPPQFMGSRTSYGQQSSTLRHNPTTSHTSSASYLRHAASPTSPLLAVPVQRNDSPLSPSGSLGHSTDVIAAANSLLRNGAASASASQNATANDHQNFASEMASPSEATARPSRSHPHPPAEVRRAENRENIFPDVMYGTTSAASLAPRANVPNDINWGSDVNFGTAPSFLPRSAKETGEALEKEGMNYIDCLEVSQSAGNTRPPSPTRTPASKHRTRVPGVETATADDSDAPPRKRRKSRVQAEADGSDDDLSTAEPAKVRRRRAKADGASAPLSGDGGRRRKGGSSGASKQPRENLTDEQKRENHIKSEQKRRTLIKEGFVDLCLLVPGLRDSGFSKSVMLTMAADWLEELIQDNKKLRQQLAEIERH